MAEDATYLSYRIWKYQSGTDLEVLGLEDAMHSAGGEKALMSPSREVCELQ